MFTDLDLQNLKMMINRAAPFNSLEEAQVAVLLITKLEAEEASREKKKLEVLVASQLTGQSLVETEDRDGDNVS